MKYTVVEDVVLDTNPNVALWLIVSPNILPAPPLLPPRSLAIPLKSSLAEIVEYIGSDTLKDVKVEEAVAEYANLPVTVTSFPILV